MAEKRMLRVERRNSTTPIESKPRWIRTQVSTGPELRDMRERVAGASLHTVCQEAGSPQPPRVLGIPRSDLPYRRITVLPQVRLLPDRIRQARSS